MADTYYEWQEDVAPTDFINLDDWFRFIGYEDMDHYFSVNDEEPIPTREEIRNAQA